MKKLYILTLAVVLAVGTLFLSSPALYASARETKVMDLNSMTGVPRPYTGAINAIRGIPGGGLPWVIGSAEGELKANGKLELQVMGLVIDPNDPAAIARGVAGTNPSASFKVIVSCLSKDADENPTTVNTSSALFPADASGNAKIEDKLSLPQPCIAPIIFVASPAGAWFAATGF